MPSSISRRDLIAGTAGAVATPLFDRSPLIHLPSAVKPVVISSGNGNSFRNGGKETCVERAFRLMTSGTDVLDALIEGVNIVELDPHESSVGYGGIPNADGVVQLDSCCMHGPKRWAGGVAALEGVRTPSKVAKLVASGTDHHLLVGKGAQEFARAMGFTIEEDLNTEQSRRAWVEWKRRTDPTHYLDPAKRDQAGLEAALAMSREGWIDPEHVWGTINCNGISPAGELAGVTTTSGLAFKIPGRVGDSPVLGAGLYVDGQVGAAGSTGRGEANLYNLCSLLVVEELRRGAHPKDAGLAALKRVVSNTKEKRLLEENGRPNFGLNFYVLDARGRHASVGFGHSRYAVCDEKGARFEEAESLYP
ncbi:N(4)-(beta-N-acetylglucosaminyl)-L-asparaginase [Fimbriimonas ginsengisoli]|uniref:Putative asparaginase n=1 Tax=Fimbriimonas ginsengisoli Gsoil 348 TaxID=661478 RepID=A0A068NLT6_FIMGI|nr:N(4)-(beta-N-acetylglucosaminyl)-L-asparaginase [Fimbriimonas ginsengisoli]AIE84436.1 putative asparaginase [Fimbriimonas ginsengisoli Gsoil 348]